MRHIREATCEHCGDELRPGTIGELCGPCIIQEWCEGGELPPAFRHAYRVAGVLACATCAHHVDDHEASPYMPCALDGCGCEGFEPIAILPATDAPADAFVVGDGAAGGS